MVCKSIEVAFWTKQSVLIIIDVRISGVSGRPSSTVDGSIDWLYATKTVSFKSYNAFRSSLALLVFTVHALIAHACVLTRCSQDKDYACATPAQQRC